MNEPVTISDNDDRQVLPNNDFLQDVGEHMGDIDDLLAEAFFGEDDNGLILEGNRENDFIIGESISAQYNSQEPGLLPGQGSTVSVEDDCSVPQSFSSLQSHLNVSQNLTSREALPPQSAKEQGAQFALAAITAQQRQYVDIAPAISPEEQSQAITAVNWITQPQQLSEAGSAVNPFLTLTAVTQGGGLPLASREQFFDAALAQRAKTRAKRQMSGEQTERRRERNRQLAKKTRERKKNHMTALQDEILELQRANAELKHIVKSNIDESEKILNECDAIEKVPQTVWEACRADKQEISSDDYEMVSSIQKSQTAFCITDPSFEDNPIVFVSPDFLKLTGYSREQVIGRNCRFLQGTHTCPDKVNQIRQALAAGEDIGITLINYKADGTPFWNRLFIAAVRDVSDNIVNYMGVSVQVAGPEPGDPEHDKELQ